MTEYDELVRALIVERYRRWPPPDERDNDAREVAAALAREKPRARGRPMRTQKTRRSTGSTDRGRST